MKVILYHGTASAFDAFDDSFEGRGVEPNSALGIHLTESSSTAADYARIASTDDGAGEPVVLEIEVEVERACVCVSREEFFGYDEQALTDALFLSGREAAASIRREARPRFVEARKRLIADGFDAVAVDAIGDDVSGGWVVFDPSRLRIIRRLTPDEADVIDGRADYSGVVFEGKFKLESGIESPAPETAPTP